MRDDEVFFDYGVVSRKRSFSQYLLCLTYGIFTHFLNHQDRKSVTTTVVLVVFDRVSLDFCTPEATSTAVVFKANRALSATGWLLYNHE